MSLSDQYKVADSPFRKNGEIYYYYILSDNSERYGIIKCTSVKNKKEYSNLEHDYGIATGVEPDVTWTVRPSLVKKDDSICLVYKDFTYQMLDELLSEHAIGLAEFLELGIQISDSVSKMHSAGIIHKDLKPENIFINPDTRQVKIIGFGISNKFLSEQLQALTPPAMLEGTLAYLSPEQTGKMNRVIDYRSDTYSLGITFYSILTGRLPFNASSPVDWVFSHISKIPSAPKDILPQTDQVVSDIIMKMISKLPEDRYQSMEGLKHDLKKCRDQLQLQKKIIPFTLGERDFSADLQVSQKLYGREDELEKLMEAYESVKKSGNTQLILVSGYSGSGKTVLVKEFQKAITGKRGFFISGKFEHFKRDIPYFTFADAFRTLLKIILAEPDDIIARWKKSILDAVGNNGKIIIDIIPESELVIGKQPPVPELPPAESRNRFERVIQNFLGAFAQEQSPLTIFLDDIQWADKASLALIQNIISNSGINNIFIIGAYRDNEVFPSHPLIETLREIQKANITVREIKLSPLKIEHVESLIADTLKRWNGDIHNLAELIFEKTAGNPFFTIQFIKTLYQEDLIKFESKFPGWKWELKAIKAKQYTDNVVDLMATKINKFDNKTRNLLGLGACVGNTFSISVLAAMAEEEESEVLEELKAPFHAGLLISQNHSVKFLHDRVQQAAYLSLPEETQVRVQIKIGRLLLAHTPQEKINSQIFDIVNHYNLGDISVLDKDERIEIAGLNLLAARKAKNSNAYESATRFAEAGINLLTEKDWTDHYELMFNLHLENAECKYLNGQLAEVEQHLGYLSGKALYNTDHTNVCLVKMRVHISKGEMLPAINTALQYLKFFHLSIPLHPTEEDVIAAYETVNQGIGNRKIEDLTNLPLMEDIEIQSVMRILSELYAPAYFSNPNLFFLLLTQMINLSMKYGNTNASVLAYGAFGYGLAAAYKKYEEGYHFAKSGVELADKHNFLSYKAKALFFFAIVSFWRKDINTSMDLCRQAFSHALETGDIHIAGYSCINYITFRNIKGEDLDEFSNAIQGYLDYVRKVKFIDMETQLISFQAFAESMQGHTFNISTFNKYDFNEELFEKVLQDRIPAIQCYYYILKLKVKYISGNFDEALIAASTANNLIQYILGLGEITEFYFFYSLTLSAKYKLASDEEKKIYLNILLQNQKIYEVWTESSPETFDNKHKLISAEICRITFRKEEAMSLYEAALRSSKKNNFPADEAICYEVASRFYFDEGFGEFGRLYIKKAIEAYFKWGALGKVKQLEVLYPFIREADTVSSSASLAGIPVEHLDIVAITNAFQVISSEIVLEQLIKSMIQIMIKQAGAQKAFLFLEWKNEIHIAAEAAVVNNKTEINVFDSFLTPDPEIVPASIIAYTRRTFEKVIIQDAKQPNLYSEDPYFKENSISSIACIPIIKQAKLLGILYLENNIFTNAFTLDKTSVLEILSSQAAISIENAMLFKELSLSRQWFQDMIDNSSSYIFVKQLDGRYLFINKGYENLYGIPRDKLVSKTDYQIWPEEVADTTTAHDMEVLEKKQALTYEEKGALHGETRHYITVRFPLLDNTGKPYAVGGISTDITNIKAAKEQLRQKTEELLETNQELIQTNIELKRVNNDLDNFIYTASHDLKAPISNMEGLLITLFQDYYEECPEGTKQLLEMMNVSVHNLKRTIHELTDISTIQKNIKEDYSLVNIEEIYEEYKKSHEELIEKCKVTFHIEFDITEILFSKKNLRSIFNNLVNNAIKYHHPGRVPEISITTRREDNFMVLSVADNGLGFDISQKDKIFGMFKRLHNHVKGSGVGLYIVKRIVENSGGKIEVESKPDKGSVFSIYLQLTVK